MAEQTFTVEVTMQERWIPHFLSMLERMERNGNVEHSEFVALYSDGDGDFRPKFKADVEFTPMPALVTNDTAIYDAG